MFQKIYPTPHTGASLHAHDVKDWFGVKGDESRLTRCQFCSWICDPDRESEIKDGSFAGRGVSYEANVSDMSSLVKMGNYGVNDDTWAGSGDEVGTVFTASSSFTARYIWAYIRNTAYTPTRQWDRVYAEIRTNANPPVLLQQSGSVQVEPDLDGDTLLYRWYRFEMSPAYDYVSGTSYYLGIGENRVGYGNTLISRTGNSATASYLYGSGSWSAGTANYSIFATNNAGLVPGIRHNEEVGGTSRLAYKYEPISAGGCPNCGSFLYR